MYKLLLLLIPCGFWVMYTANMPDHRLSSKNHLSPLEPLVGGKWVGEFDLPNGKKVKQERFYDWSLGHGLITGKTFRITDSGKRQTREVIFIWNPDKERIEFWDFIDTGGYGKGFVKVTGEKSLYMEAKIVGSNHVDWRANFEFPNNSTFVSRVEIPQNGSWIEAGTFLFKKK